MARRLVQTPSPHCLWGDQPLWAQPQASNEAQRARSLGAAACWLDTPLQAGFSARPALAQQVAFPMVWGEGRPIQAEQVRPRRAAPFQGPRLGPGPTLGDAGAHTGGSQALGVLGRRGGGPGTRGPALQLTRCPHWGREGAAGHGRGGAGGQEAGTAVGGAGEEGGAGGLRHPGSGSPQGGSRAPEHITGVLVWTDLPPSASGLALAGWSTLLQPQARPLRAPGPLVELSPVPGHVSWEGPAPPSGLALTCPPGELAGSTCPWLAGQGMPQWLALAFCSSEMARPGWMSGRRRSLPPGVFLRLREREGAEGPGSPPCLHHVCAQNPSSS